MTSDQLYKELNYVNHSRENRKKYADLVIANPELLHSVLDFMFNVNDKQSVRAAWLLEFVARENLNTIIPFLDRITSGMHTIYLDAAVRPVAKICEYLIQAYDSKLENKIKTNLKQQHIDKIVELCFDYLITEQKIAPKAYSMTVLYILGKSKDWIHPELAIILERDIEIQSSGFKARAKHILKKIKVK